MPKDIPRLQWFGDGDGDDTTRSRSSSVWLGFAQLLMPKEYDRVEAIRRHRREVKLERKAQAEVEADAEAAAAEAVTAQQVIASAGDAERNQAGEAAAADGSAEVQQHDVEQEQEQAQAEDLNLNLNQMKPAPAANKRGLVQQVLVPDATGAGTRGNKTRARLHSIASNKLAAKGIKVRTHTNPAPNRTMESSVEQEKPGLEIEKDVHHRPDPESQNIQTVPTRSSPVFENEYKLLV
ncbi:hypothetical protein LTR99_009307 [Exophiala xenobiotica]|uniref:Uncharacterized protein n=1 Tax=Vermiconidia calcicola TaxID=1690605 RepID=A0AAV9PZX7_9PEZI|nr:hypothetical protein LTR41_003896 [Exophiala xenobiotica]KAK5531020.1 hypothetical protein LTR25_008877 [Vermiconidia calcicola]KAK5536271.1 hypothetical protein LTR23_007989 [Chaetothyriales sp. CCFEE 6169]KAK5238375.1 hypothetical protein LTR47_000118 [Exophiala xenobiotica]KAK5252646.1 hypothetical protein LTS06_002823 [Exophiala xenobiotica]